MNTTRCQIPFRLDPILSINTALSPGSAQILLVAGIASIDNSEPSPTSYVGLQGQNGVAIAPMGSLPSEFHALSNPGVPSGDALVVVQELTVARAGSRTKLLLPNGVNYFEGNEDVSYRSFASFGEFIERFRKGEYSVPARVISGVSYPARFVVLNQFNNKLYFCCNASISTGWAENISAPNVMTLADVIGNPQAFE